MRLEAIKSFVTLVQTGSYPAAAEHLFLSPTTVHGHVKGLEDEIKATLVIFNGRQLDLTQAGMRYFFFAERVLDEQAKMERDISGLLRRESGRLRVVSLPGPSVHLLPPVVRAFREKHPEVTVSVNATGVGECQAALASGEADLAILNDRHTVDLSAGFEEALLYEDTLILVIPAELYEAPDIALLERYPIAAQAKSSAYRNFIERWARREGITLNTVFEHSSFDGLIAYALEAGCVAMAGGYMVKTGPYASRLRVLNLPDFEMHRRIVGLHSTTPDWPTAEFATFFREFYARPAATPQLAVSC